eukprot:3910405-Prymnesium_polylepis.2
MFPNIPEWLLCWAQGEKNASLQVFGSVDRGEVCTRQDVNGGCPAGAGDDVGRDPRIAQGASRNPGGRAIGP